MTVCAVGRRFFASGNGTVRVAWRAVCLRHQIREGLRNGVLWRYCYYLIMFVYDGTIHNNRPTLRNLLLAVIVFNSLLFRNVEFEGDEMKRKQIAKLISNNANCFHDI